MSELYGRDPMEPTEDQVEEFVTSSIEPDPLMEEVNSMYAELCETGMCDTNPIAQRALGALEAVLAIPELGNCHVEGCENRYEHAHQDAYNAALSDVRSAIAEALGDKG